MATYQIKQMQCHCWLRVRGLRGVMRPLRLTRVSAGKYLESDWQQSILSLRVLVTLATRGVNLTVATLRQAFCVAGKLDHHIATVIPS